MSEEKQKIILASQSPRRREILAEMGLDFEVVPANVDESAVKQTDPKELVIALSMLKANAIATTYDVAVIAADTIVVMNGEVFGKPHTEDVAVGMIKKLNAAWHTVYTGVTVKFSGATNCFVVESQVKFKNLSDEQIVDYVKDCKPLDKAGAYGIQDKRIVETYKGSYSNIVGLPREELKKTLEKMGVI